jgi:hypothetical protein
MVIAALLIGFILGIIAVLALIYIIFLNPFGNIESPSSFIDQFPPIRIPAVNILFISILINILGIETISI